MPVYLCKPGMNSLDPWRHGIPVYAHPFPLRGATGVSNSLGKDADMDVGTRRENAEDMATDVPTTTTTTTNTGEPHRLPVGLTREESRTPPSSETSSLTGRPSRHWTPSETAATSAIRRIRHSEVILVDDVVYQYSNYWLRLRWPGSNGGFAGYVCLVAHTNTIQLTADEGTKVKDTGEWGPAGRRCVFAL
jgi:hypothetical protein